MKEKSAASHCNQITGKLMNNVARTSDERVNYENGYDAIFGKNPKRKITDECNDAIKTGCLQNICDAFVLKHSMSDLHHTEK